MSQHTLPVTYSARPVTSPSLNLDAVEYDSASCAFQFLRTIWPCPTTTPRAWLADEIPIEPFVEVLTAHLNLEPDRRHLEGDARLAQFTLIDAPSGLFIVPAVRPPIQCATLNGA